MSENKINFSSVISRKATSPTYILEVTLEEIDEMSISNENKKPIMILVIIGFFIYHELILRVKTPTSIGGIF